MRTFEAANAINRAKQLRGFKQDQELAEFLGVSRTSLASWKRRNSIPAKHLLQMVFGTERSVDWLISGEEKVTVDEFGLSTTPFVDPYVLWLALLAYRLELNQGNEAQHKLYEAINDQELMYAHIYLGDFITKLMNSKDKWQKSGLVKDRDVYKAIATEFGLSSFEFPPIPWWEDEKIV